MLDQLSEVFKGFKSFMDQHKSALFNSKQKIAISEDQKIHVLLVAQLTKITSLIDSQPAVMQTCEQARFLIANTPVGTIAGQKQLINAIKQLELVQGDEPQIRKPLMDLKPLAEKYLSL